VNSYPGFYILFNFLMHLKRKLRGHSNNTILSWRIRDIATKCHTGREDFGQSVTRYFFLQNISFTWPVFRSQNSNFYSAFWKFDCNVVPGEGAKISQIIIRYYFYLNGH